MTLDLLKVIDALRQAVVESSVQTRHREPELLDLLATFDDDEVLQRIERAKTSWLLGIALDRYFVKYPAPAIPADGYSCIATDGSIVASDRHGPLAYAVVNIGFCILQYGQTPEAHLGAEPTVLWREEDLWIADGARRIPVSGTVLGLRRAVMELRAGLSWIDRVTAPSVVLLDGTLIPWGLEGQATTVVQWVMRSSRQHWQRTACGEYQSRGSSATRVPAISSMSCGWPPATIRFTGVLSIVTTVCCAFNAESANRPVSSCPM